MSTPRHIAIIGAGAWGIALAQNFAAQATTSHFGAEAPLTPPYANFHGYRMSRFCPPYMSRT